MSHHEPARVRPERFSTRTLLSLVDPEKLRAALLQRAAAVQAPPMRAPVAAGFTPVVPVASDDRNEMLKWVFGGLAILVLLFGGLVVVGGAALWLTSSSSSTTNREPTASPANQPSNGGQDTYQGELSSADRRLDSGHYVDVLELEARAGEVLTVQVVGQGFQPEVIVLGPSDSHRWESTGGTVTFQAPSSGTYALAVTSTAPGAVGRYQLSLSSR